MVEVLAEWAHDGLTAVVYEKDGKPLDVVLYEQLGPFSEPLAFIQLHHARDLGHFLTEHCRVDDDPITALLDEAREANDG